jgi:predicted ATPase
MRLLERDHPLTVLRDCARGAVQGRGCMVLVAGEAGIGKTVLLRALAEEPPAPVLWGMCDPLSTPRPLGPRKTADHHVSAILGKLQLKRKSQPRS